MTPVITVPTTCPRRSGGAMPAACGTITMAATLTRPSRKNSQMRRSSSAHGITASTAAAVVTRTVRSRLRSTASPSGTSANRPSA